MSAKSSDNTDELEKIDLRLIDLEQERSALLLKREKLVGISNIDTIVVHQTSSTQEKMDAFQSYFSGRTDVYAYRWESRNGKTGYSPSYLKKQQGRKDLQSRKCDLLSQKVIYQHLAGNKVIGIYPLLK